MNIQQIEDAFNLIQTELSPEAEIILDLTMEQITPMVSLLKRYSIPVIRGTHLLSIYMTIELALQRHAHCEQTPDQLTRSVLDGDYLYSFYVQLCLLWDEYDFLSSMASVIKQIQIQRVEERPEDDRLLRAIALFLHREFGQHQSEQAM